MKLQLALQLFNISSMRPISILCNAYLPEHYKIETGSGARLVMVSIWGKNRWLSIVRVLIDPVKSFI